MRGHDDHASGSEPERIEPDETVDAVPPEPGPSTGTTAPADREISRWRLRNWRLRSKLAVVLLVPALSTLTLAGLRLNTQLDDVELYGKVQRELQLSAQAAAVSDALQLERDAAVWFVAGGRADNSADLVARSAKVDQEVGEYREVAASTSGIDESVRESFQKSLQSLDGLSALRNTTLTTKYPDISVASAYGQVLSALAQVHRTTASSLSNEEITPLSGANLALYSAKEQLFQQNAILLSTAKRGEFAPGQVNALRAAQSRLDAALTDFANTSTQENRQRYSDTVSGAAVDARSRLVQLALVQQDESGEVSISDAEVMRVGEETGALYRQISLDIEQQADRTAVNLTEGARGAAWRDAALVAVALLLAFALMAFVARSMLTPLRVLRRAAMDVARNRLPEAIKRIRTHRDPARAAEESLVPVPIHTTEEVGQVARAFDAVQREAVRLAVEQVALRANVNDMFINLSRRSQALVERQITVIDRLEQDEQDPDQLASLFELDHLATQMRRNSENLLVLSGTTVNRRVTRPVPINEVLGAAVSEVEKYARVQVAPAPELKVQGRVVNDLAHLIAELLDNATAFSKPTTKVTVRAIETRRGEVSIRIHDRGVGMQEQDIIDSNIKLAEPPEVDVSVAREMGLYVVGQLAKRHEIRVTLTNNDDIEGGVTAQVVLPVSLLHRGPEPLAARPAPALPQRQAPLEIEGSGVGVLAGVPKWTPDQAPASFTAPDATPAPFPAPAETAAPYPQVVQAPADEGPNYFQVEQTPAADLFTATVVETQPPAQGAIDYSYPGTAAAPPIVVEEDDASTQRLPIYEDVLSRWFQGTEGAEAAVHGELGDTVPPETPAERTMFADRVDLVGPDPSAEPTVYADRVDLIGDPDRPEKPEKVERVSPTPTAAGLPKRAPAPSPVPATTTGWGPADEGWSAAGDKLKSEVDDTTTAGLPKRVPNARLMPGSLSAPPQRPSSPSANGSSAASGVATAAPPRRSADRLRQRFATYQRGIQLGRESADENGMPWEGAPFGNGENPGNQGKEQT
ncbi:nitrate- and nitrite sensing domain-containing protein [Actinosynnema sp. NPDC047251]|uniref:histidine kinase n=1 Tax=Saccharothrix espanaensis (strain ATCC 51144 / DSM 44229 / JCM 9112 / NBRC 15066 / NRRL 15764) TaxID=1179773 RepID=K0KAE7_SACES|nr:nitrate- and nitrite sensing domain-containing protein [Saccharothrix espanaensis]CCH33794.1 Sensor protein with HAMP domain [Saccharothrix espanaensis DSM 44229]